jgi:DNA-directed RNA polymerase subunit N (RpoN/RPB10)
MKIITYARKERQLKYNENLVEGFVESNIDYLPPIRCSCRKPVMIKKYDLFYELIDPEGPYKLSYNQAFEEIELHNKCCQHTFVTPPVISTEASDYDIRYASGKINPERRLMDKEGQIPSTLGNSYVTTFDSNLARNAFPQIQSSYERKALVTNNVQYNVDPDSQIIIPPDAVRIGTLNIGGEEKVPVFSKHVNLRALRRK